MIPCCLLAYDDAVDIGRHVLLMVATSCYYMLFSYVTEVRNITFHYFYDWIKAKLYRSRFVKQFVSYTLVNGMVLNFGPLSHNCNGP